ncbi:MAG: Holliday junction branch migration protein RuvA [Ruminococcaceae bacterium]|nr:Holliday junction branch migration protein RuvA [Oscillospiraceae bacterium]
MIASLHGILIDKDNVSVVVECGGVGMRCLVTAVTSAALPALGQEVFLYTHFAVREDSMDLYGFAEKSELEIFRLLTSVSGVGPKIGLALLSQFTADNILLFIAGGDAKSLTAASGVGKKMAEKIVFELRDKVGSIAEGKGMSDVMTAGNASANTMTHEAIEALVSLGFSQSESALAVGRLDPSLPTDELIKQALKDLSRRV